jgi:serine/threonine protein kinase
MPDHFLAAGVYGCVYYPGYTCKGNAMKKKKWVSKLTDRSDKTDTEIEIGKRLKNVPGYEENFVLVQRDCMIPYKSLSSMKKGCDMVKKEKDKHTSYVLLYSPYIPSIELYKYLKNKPLFVRVFRCFYQICKKISILIENNIIHHDLHFANILYSTENAKLYLIDFGLSLLADQFQNETYLATVFSRFVPKWSWYSLEIHLLCYLMNKKQLTEKAILQTIDIYLENHMVFKRIPELLLEYKKDAIDYFLPLANLDSQTCVNHLISFWDTWDYYEISLRFLYIYSENNISYPAYFENLRVMCQANPEKRPNILPIYKTIQAFDLSSTKNSYIKADVSVMIASSKKID